MSMAGGGALWRHVNQEMKTDDIIVVQHFFALCLAM